MRYLIFSDTHLDTTFQASRLYRLEEAIDQCDRVIINGDFWNYNRCDLTDFLKSRWSVLFAKLKAKHTIYIYGNHDLPEWNDARVKEFSDKQKLKFKLGSGRRRFVITHGDKLVLSGYKAPWFIGLDRKLHLTDLLDVITATGERIFGKAGLSEKLLQSYNERIKAQLSKHFRKKYFLVTGHTHKQEFDLQSRYANSGLFDYGRAEYMFIDDGQIELVKRAY